MAEITDKITQEYDASQIQVLEGSMKCIMM